MDGSGGSSGTLDLMHPPLHPPAAWLFSKPYCIAMLAAALEYAVELRWAPGLKRGLAAEVVSLCGLAAVLGGEALRKSAMVGGG